MSCKHTETIKQLIEPGSSCWKSFDRQSWLKCTCPPPGGAAQQKQLQRCRLGQRQTARRLTTHRSLSRRLIRCLSCGRRDKGSGGSSSPVWSSQDSSTGTDTADSDYGPGGPVPVCGEARRGEARVPPSSSRSISSILALICCWTHSTCSSRFRRHRAGDAAGSSSSAWTCESTETSQAFLSSSAFSSCRQKPSSLQRFNLFCRFSSH